MLRLVLVCCVDDECFGWVDILFVMLRLTRWQPSWEMAVHEASADDVLSDD